MIEFLTYRPDRFNLNGDQANIFALGKRLEWANVPFKVATLENFEQLDNPVNKFLLLGHGSAAAMRSVSNEVDELRAKVLASAEAGLVGLAVGSGYELLFPQAKRRERLSDYADVPASAELPRLHGYVNTDAELPLAQVLGTGFVCAMVHGPVVPRTPELASWFFERLGVEVPVTAESAEADKYALEANQH